MTSSLLYLRNKVALFGLWFGGSLILLSACIIGIDVLIRKLFSISVGGADELAQFALALGSVWGFSGALVDRFHIRVDSAYHKLPRWFQLGGDFLSLICLFIFFSVITWHAKTMVLESWMHGTVSKSALQIPIFVPQLLWLIGLVSFLLAILITAICASNALLKGNRDQVRELISVKSVEQEFEEELHKAQEVEILGRT